MKNKIAKAGLCVFAAGLLFTGSVYGAELAKEYDDNASAITSYGTAFWRKKDKSNMPETETPEASPSPSATPTGVPKDVPKEQPKAKPGESPQASPVAVPKESPQADPKETPKETSEKENDIETSLVSYYQPNSRQNQGQQGQPQNQQNQQNQPNQQNQQRQNNNQNQGQTGGNYHYNSSGGGHRSSGYTSGIGEEIQRILDSQPGIQLDPNAYIVQLDDDLWLVVGNIRAKLDILIYVDQKNMKESEYNHGNAIPLYK